MEDEHARPEYHVDAADYVDAATFALRVAAVELGPAPAPPTTELSQARPVAPRELRDAMGCLVTGVCVITTVTAGEDVAMTANSVTSVSLDPPLVLVCIAHTARFHDAITRAETWGLSILDADAVPISAAFARPGADRRQQLAELRHHRGPVTGVALLDSSCATLECRTEVIHPGGDHSIVVGRVVATAQQSEPALPLVFHRGQYQWLRV